MKQQKTSEAGVRKIRGTSLFDDENGDEFLVYSGGKVDLQNRRDMVAPGDVTGFSCSVSAARAAWILRASRWK